MQGVLNPESALAAEGLSIDSQKRNHKCEKEHPLCLELLQVIFTTSPGAKSESIEKKATRIIAITKDELIVTCELKNIPQTLFRPFVDSVTDILLQLTVMVDEASFGETRTPLTRKESCVLR